MQAIASQQCNEGARDTGRYRSARRRRRTEARDCRISLPAIRSIGQLRSRARAAAAAAGTRWFVYHVARLLYTEAFVSSSF